ncbi:hypothetical protein BDN72DRAFT_930502 [Pluteus cervinus]|uniref:Uncharacterized protein n=1 Tax=Pluteus cervinus TaxID=181527 RepID=A0ACD3BDR4_9AGAR|nr:hypothetical protein BDN72DRAFT_930502 [Pluteus cervinus]
MEKFSAYRDPGTGIQPFLTPVPPTGSASLAKLIFVIGLVVASIRTGLVLILLVSYVLLVKVVCLLLIPITPIHRAVSHGMTAIIGRMTLFVLGFYQISVEHVARKRGYRYPGGEKWNPQAGDLIISNWVSWIELLWLAIKFDPVFVLPIADPLFDITAAQPAHITSAPGRRTGTGSANIQSSQARTVIPRQSIKGFCQVSLLTLIGLTGEVPTAFATHFGSAKFLPLDEIRKKASRPVVVFPECTTSNGRGLLRFSNVFNQTIPTRHGVFIMCVRYDPPTALVPSLSHSVPSASLNPLYHFWSIASSLSPLTISIRLLDKADSPSSPLFIASEVLSGRPDEDQLSEASAVLISQIGRLKRVGMGWEDKYSFLDFFRHKRT